MIVIRFTSPGGLSLRRPPRHRWEVTHNGSCDHPPRDGGDRYHPRADPSARRARRVGGLGNTPGRSAPHFGPASLEGTNPTRPLRPVNFQLRKGPPRTRGDHPSSYPSASRARQSAPHARGSSQFDGGLLLPVRVRPALAGIIPAGGGGRRGGCGPPRTRGDHPAPCSNGPGSAGSAPHARGSPLVSTAGIAFAASSARMREDHPRCSSWCPPQAGAPCARWSILTMAASGER